MTAGVTGRGGTISVLDIGTSKICCLIARAGPERSEAANGRRREIEVLGFAHQRSNGVRGGVIADLSAAEQAIRKTVDAAETRAGVAVGSLYVNVASDRVQSQAVRGTTSVSGDEVSGMDVERALRDAARQTRASGMRTLHSMPSRFKLDEVDEIDDPVGMVGSELSVTCNVARAPEGALRNLERAINRAHVEVERMVATPYASALAATLGDEAELGCVSIDMGAATTSWAIMSGDRLVHADAIPVGGQHVTSDLARGLSITIEQAERLKVLEASVATAGTGNDHVTVAPFASDGSAALAMVPREQIARIVTPRLEETFELVRKRIRASGYGRHADRRVILTGGAAQLTGVADLARRMLARNVRVGRPVGVRGLAPQHKTPAFSAAIGLAVFPQFADRERHVGSSFALPTTGRFARLGRWFRDF